MDIADFARERCIADPAVVLLLAVGNLGIFLAYVLIPAAIVKVAAGLRRIPAEPLWWLFGAFILGCGLTHAVSILVLFRPAFYLEAWLCLATASISLATAFVLWRRARALTASLEAAEDLRLALESEPKT